MEQMESMAVCGNTVGKRFMREELADRFCSHLAECRKAWKAAGMTVAEQKEAEETEISLILEKMESEEKAEETQLLSSSEMQNYVDTVCDQILLETDQKSSGRRTDRPFAFTERSLSGGRIVGGRSGKTHCGGNG